jgi:PQQ enzyme repeat
MDHGRRFGWILVPTLACALLWVNCGNGGHTQSQADAGPPIDVITDVPRSDAHGPGVSVLQLHLNPTRDGAYVDAVMRPGVAAGMHLSSGFPAPVTGLVRGDPLYVDQWKPGQDAIFVATDHNHVTAIDATTGAQLWDVIVGPMVILTNLPCPMSFPFGIMTTPIIDLPSRTMYVDSFQTIGGTTQKHYVYALSIDDGKTMPGWPVDVAAKVPGFNATDQNNHGALTLMNGTLYLPYGPVNGDCGNYHGWVVGISTTDPTQVEAYSTTANRGGIWTAVSSDGTSVFASSANNARGTTTWGGGETFFRFTPGPKFSGAQTDYFTPSNWQALDNGDWDLGSSAPILFDVPEVTPSKLAVAMGKYGVVHLLDRYNLGGIGNGNGITGEGLFSMAVTPGQTSNTPAEIRGTGAFYTTAKGHYLLVPGRTTISVCPGGTTGNLLAMTLSTTSPPTLVPAWCASTGGTGSPIVTTTDGTSNPIVWVVGAQGTDQLVAFDGDTGSPVYTSGGGKNQMGLIYEWTSPIDANGRIVVGGTNAVYSFVP